MDLLTVLLSVFAGMGLILLLPIRGARKYTYTPPSRRFHEADSVLSRRLLIPGTEAYDSFYKTHPEWKEPDDRSRRAPGLLSPGSKNHDPGTFSAANANFRLIRILDILNHDYSSTQIQDTVSPKVTVNPLIADHTQINNNTQDTTGISEASISRFISSWLLNTGAHSVGFTHLEDYHLYSHKGRGLRNGEPIRKIHTNAIVLTVEMDHRMMSSSPLGTAVMESSEQYLRSGVLALKTAAFIRDMGYEATAHIDGDYDVICPLVAVDAGLGTIGRMGLLMTPGLGPRVRIAVVTTSMPLVPSGSQPDRTVLHFCNHCKKCAESCPVAAIPEGNRESLDDTLRWKIHAEKCYHYWTLTGTDCGRCMSVCPYSHSRSIIHRFVRWGIKNNLLFRHLAIKLDDMIFSRRPDIRPPPGWIVLQDHKP